MPRYDYGYESSRALAGSVLAELAASDERIWSVTSDIGGSLVEFKKKFPERYLDVGIAEQIACGAAAGLALEGYRPYIVGMIPFITMRAFEQVRTDLCYQNLPVTLIGTGGGLVSGGGATHNAMEDVAIMRALANMSVVSVSDPVMIKSLVRHSLDWDGPLFIRQAAGKKDRVLYDPQLADDFPIGKGITARPGEDMTIIAHGAMVAYALDIAEEMASRGIDIRVIDMYSIKPLDEELALRAVRETGRILVVEDHLRRGGLSGAIAELYMDEGIVPRGFKRLGIPDVYPGYGTGEQLREKYGYGKAGIIAAIEELCS